jgi:hypothetical protein
MKKEEMNELAYKYDTLLHEFLAIMTEEIRKLHQRP